jgi:hypothetical protein
VRPVRCDGKRIGYAIVEEGKVTSLDLEEGFMLDLLKGEHEVTIELGPTFDTDPNTGDMVYTLNYLSSKFTI